VNNLYLDDLTIGHSAELTRTVTAADIEAFAEVTGDTNPLHLDDAYAATTPFGQRIAHGMLTASYISAVLGTQLSGPGSIYVSQSLRFRRPVKIGDVVTATATITDIDLVRARVTLETKCVVAGKTVIDGEATVIAQRRPA
jgi:3-hydroxybutyryl-CoA dehydratase